MATKLEIVNAIRELTFDRFVTPTFFIVSRTKDVKHTITINSVSLVIKTDGTVTSTFLFSEFPTLDSLLNALGASSIIEVVYAGSFIPSEPSTSLSPASDISLELYKPIFRKFYFSDSVIEGYFTSFLTDRLHLTSKVIDDVDWDDEFDDDNFDHYNRPFFCLWVAYKVVEKRRLYEAAALALTQSTLGGNPSLNGGLSYLNSGSFSSNAPGSEVQVTIGDVFQLSEDTGNSYGLAYGKDIPQGMLPPWAVGSDNVLMDYYSFWYRLQLWLRDQIELKYNDFSLRRNTVIDGQMYIDPRTSNKRFAYFDTYPWVFSPFLRGATTNNQNIYR